MDSSFFSRVLQQEAAGLESGCIMPLPLHGAALPLADILPPTRASPGPVRYRILMLDSWLMMFLALTEERVCLLLAPAISEQAPGEASAIAACLSVARDRVTHPASVRSHMLQRFLGKFCLSNCQMKTIKAQLCSYKSQSIRHRVTGMKAVMCSKATLLGSCAQEFRRK